MKIKRLHSISFENVGVWASKSLDLYPVFMESVVRQASYFTKVLPISSRY